MKNEKEIPPRKCRILESLLMVIKKLWGYIRRHGKSCVNVSVIVIVHKEKKDEVLVNVDVEVVRMTKDQLIDAIAASSKLTKADAGRALDTAIESSIKLRSFKAMEPEP